MGCMNLQEVSSWYFRGCGLHYSHCKPDTCRKHTGTTGAVYLGTAYGVIWLHMQRPGGLQWLEGDHVRGLAVRIVVSSLAALTALPAEWRYPPSRAYVAGI